MVGDTRVIVGESHHYSTNKVFKITGLEYGSPTEELLGLVGTVEHYNRFLSWYKDDGNPDNWEDGEYDFEALSVTKDGEVNVYYNGIKPTLLHGNFFCIGSGSDVAVGAMGMGATAEQAATIACNHRTDCGLPLQVLSFEEWGK